MVLSYGKCQHCKNHKMLVCFWYCEADTTPMYLCKDCFKEFDDAMEAYKDYPEQQEEF